MSSRVERFAGGALGKAGSRVFLLEIVVEDTAVAYLIEKLQVRALALEAQELLRDCGMLGAGLSVEPGGVHGETPVAFRVGGLQLTVEDDSDSATIAIHSTEDDESVTYDLTLAQLDAFARESIVIVAAGRPACPRCGLAMDPGSHNCPRTNGDLREHRP